MLAGCMPTVAGDGEQQQSEPEQSFMPLHKRLSTVQVLMIGQTIVELDKLAPSICSGSSAAQRGSDVR